MQHRAQSTTEEPALALAPALTRDFLLYHNVCPVRADGEVIEVAALQETSANALADVARAYRRRALPHVVELRELQRLIERLSTAGAVDDATADHADSRLPADVRELVSQPPVVRYVNLLIREAHEASASDVHLEPTRDGTSARLRIDGILTPTVPPPAELTLAVISRIKLLAELDIAERRRPQDGRVRVRLDDRELDLRVSTVPTMFGESVVLRLLDQGGRPVALSELGMASRELALVERLAARPHGLVLVTGPTGSGKTTTLYSCLQRRNAREEKIVTVEDPIEYHCNGITQLPVLRQAGVTFASALRSILRQDPDVIMIGEMRDGETAEVAIQAAMTGHLVFSTLHTNDALAAIPRLLDLGIPEYLVAATLEGVVAQRLVRRICRDCIQRRSTPPAAACDALSVLMHGHTYEGRGCQACRGTGYSGRAGVFEVLVMTDELKDAISRRASRAELREVMVRGGTISLADDAAAKVRAGVTTVEEVLRVSQA